jgi:transglutaminase-like putative cysteine protease
MKTASLTTVALVLGSCASSTGEQPVDTDRKHRTFTFVYEATVERPPSGAKQVRLWLPVAQSTRDQKVHDVEIVSSHGYELHDIEHGEGRALCVTSPGEPIQVKVAAKVTRYETKNGGSASAEELRAFLQPDAMVPLDGKVAAMAASLSTPSDQVATAKVLYDHTLDRMNYDKPDDGGGWGRGDSEWACEARYGNCTDFHSYFIGLARSKEIPARFEMGFSIPGGTEREAAVGGYHCWAYFWSGDRWVPVDASEADKDASKAEYFFGTLDEHRVTMVGGRDVLLTPRPKKGSLNFFVYPYCEVDGVEFKDVKRKFSRALE